MSATVDERVVYMEFDNQHFEKNVRETMSTLDKLKQALRLDGAAKAAKSEFASYEAGLPKLRDSFNKMCATIEYEWGYKMKNLFSTLTIDPIKKGFEEYETQINAIQTILANTESKGTTLDDVNGALDELNAYADKTIYNFTEMTRNIGTFTAAGVDLDTSVSAIKGIANLAAVSGSTSQQASVAMYQLSQALSSGTVKLMDWNSVVNAGMGGQVFQDALKETARVHGIAIDDLIAKEGSFRETLQHGWLSSEILTETLSKFTGDLTEEQLKSMGYTSEQIKGIMKMGQTANDAATKVKTFSQLWDTLKEAAQSGWTQTWEIIVGDFEEARSMLTKVSDVIGEILNKSAETRNDLLENWKVLGGRDDLIESISNTFKGLISILNPVKEAFREIFPPLTAEQLAGFTAGLKELTAKFKLSDRASKNLKKTFKGIFAIVKIIAKVLLALGKVVGFLLGVILDLGGVLLSITGFLGDLVTGIGNVIDDTNIFNKVFSGLVKLCKSVYNALKTLLKFLKENFACPGLEAASSLVEVLKEAMTAAGDVAGKMAKALVSAFEAVGDAVENTAIFKFFKTLWNIVKIVVTKIGQILSSLANNMVKWFDEATFGGLLGAFLAGGVGVGIISLIKNLVGLLKNGKQITKSLKDILGTIDDVIGSVGETFEAFQSQIKAKTLLTIAKAIAILAASLLVISFIPKDKLISSLGTIVTLLGGLMGAMALVNKLSTGKGAAKLGGVMLGITASLVLLAYAVNQFKDMTWEEMAKGFVAMAVGLTLLVAAVNLLPMDSLENSGKLKKFAKIFTKLSTSLLILSISIKLLSTLTWEETAKGLISTSVAMGLMVGAITLLSKIKNTTSTKIQGFVLAIQQLVGTVLLLALVVKVFSKMSLEELAKGFVAIATGLTLLVTSILLLSKVKITAAKITGIVSAVLALSISLVVLSYALQSMGSMAWNDIGRGLAAMAASLALLVVAINLIPNGSAMKAVALLALSAAIVVLIGALQLLSLLSWNTVIEGLLKIALAFAVLGAAAVILQPLVPVITALSGAMALLGVGVLAAGAGLVLLGIGLAAVSAGLVVLVKSLDIILVGLIKLVDNLIIAVIKAIGHGIVALCEILISSMDVISEVLIALVLVLCDVLVECVPAIVDAVLKITVELLKSLVDNIPQIVDLLLDFLIAIIDGVAKRVPDLMGSIVNLIMSIFRGAIEALQNIDPEVLLNGTMAIGLMAGIMVALAGVAALTPAAMVGVLGMTAVAAELALMLSAFGALARIPGINQIIGDGGELLAKLGEAIGGFFGSIVGGVAKGMTSALPEIGTNLSDFMTNAKPFIDGASSINPSTMDGVKSLVGIMVALTGANILESVTSWLTGGSSLVKFGEELAAFAPHFKTYADTVSGINPNVVVASATAAKALTEMADSIPNEGGIVSWFTGDNSLAKFSDELPKLGAGLKGFSDQVSGVSPEAVIAAANAAKTLAEMSNTIPNSGGVTSWFAGDNSISKFSKDLKSLGEGIKGFSDQVSGVDPNIVNSATNAAKTLAEMTNTIPNSGGLASWISGDKSVSKFSGDLKSLGEGLKGFNDQVIGINPEVVTAAANAAKTLAEMTGHIPDSGGVVSWFTGDSSLSKFGGDLKSLGSGLKGFNDQVLGINPEVVTAGANAAKTLAEMSACIPDEGGVVSWFTGDNSLAKFSDTLPALGGGLKDFADSVTGINTEQVQAAANAAKTLAEMSGHIPDEGGVKSWFTGDNSLSKFSGELPKLGTGLKSFSDSVTGVNPEAITAAANAAQALATMTEHVPKEGGIKSWFTGDTNIADFADKLPTLGSGLKGFSDSVAGLNAENVTVASSAAESIANLCSNTLGNVKNVDKLADNLESLGSKMKKCFTDMGEISSGSISTAKNSFDVVEKAANLNGGNIKTVADSIDDVADSLKSLSKVPKDATSNFSKALSDMGKSSAEALLKEFENIESDMKKAGKDDIDAFSKGVEDKKSTAESACTKVMNACSKSMSKATKSFADVGSDLVDGLVSGINTNSYKAAAAAKAMAEAAVEAAREALDINSPSKIFRALGYSVPEGFAIGIDKLSGMASDSATNMANDSINNVRSTIARIADVINSDIDAQPTIRPVLDLSAVRSGANSINGLFGTESSIGVLTNVGRISSAMKHYNQNGDMTQLTSEVSKLRKDLSSVERATYNINGITYDDGSSVSDAIKTLVRAAIVERRV